MDKYTVAHTHHEITALKHLMESFHQKQIAYEEDYLQQELEKMLYKEIVKRSLSDASKPKLKIPAYQMIVLRRLLNRAIHQTKLIGAQFAYEYNIAHQVIIQIDQVLPVFHLSSSETKHIQP